MERQQRNCLEVLQNIKQERAESSLIGKKGFAKIVGLAINRTMYFAAI